MNNTDIEAQRSPRTTAWYGYRRLSALAGIAAVVAMGSLAIGCGSKAEQGPTTTTTTTTTAAEHHHHHKTETSKPSSTESETTSSSATSTSPSP
jgi:cytoskeletal protein RodZ